MGIRIVSAAIAASVAVGAAEAAPNERAETEPAQALVSVSAPDPLIDAIAAEFFEKRLRLSQSRRIEAETARQYQSLSAEEKLRFRAMRRETWRRMNADERALLRGVKQPRYSNLTESQKRAFRRIAAQEIGAAPAPLLSASLRDEI